MPAGGAIAIQSGQLELQLMLQDLLAKAIIDK